MIRKFPNDLTTGLFFVTAANLLAAPALASTDGCQNGERKLPWTGLCESEAALLLPKHSTGFSKGAEALGCGVKLNEARFLEGAILYWASDCKGQVAELEMRVKGMDAELYVVRSNLTDSIQPDKAGEFTGGLTISPVEFATNTAQTQMAHFSQGRFKEPQIEKCKARKEPSYGPNAYVVDEYSLENLPTGEASYRDACGEYGMVAGETQYWLVGENSTWFFSPRFQDAMKDFERQSITFAKKDASGKWVKNDEPGKAMEAAMVIDNNYEVANVAGLKGVKESLYGKARDYQVSSAVLGGEFKYCVAERDFDGSKLRIGYDGAQWQVAVPYPSKPDYYSAYDVDGISRGMGGTSDGTWTFWWLGMPELDQLRNGNMLIMDIGRASLDFPLKGSWAAITKVEECVQREGRKSGS